MDILSIDHFVSLFLCLNKLTSDDKVTRFFIRCIILVTIKKYSARFLIAGTKLSFISEYFNTFKSISKEVSTIKYFSLADVFIPSKVPSLLKNSLIFSASASSGTSVLFSILNFVITSVFLS